MARFVYEVNESGDSNLKIDTLCSFNYLRSL